MEAVSSGMGNLQKKIDLLKKSIALYFGNKRFAWLVYNDLKKNDFINEKTTSEEFGKLFAGRSTHIIDYLLSKYHYVLSDDDILVLIDFNKAILRSVYENKQFTLCRKISLNEQLNEEDQIVTIQNVPPEVLGKKLRLIANFINIVLYESDISLKVMAYKRNINTNSEASFEDIVKRNSTDFLTKLTKKEADSYIKLVNNLKEADEKEVCKFTKDFITEILYKEDQPKQNLRLLFIRSFLLGAKLDPSLSYLDDEIKKIKIQSDLRKHLKM